MTKKKNNTLFTPIRVFIGFLVFSVIFALGIFFVGRSNENDLISEGQIRIEKGGKIVTVNENGLVEYKSEKGIFYETWDNTKTLNFFDNMRARARAYLKKPTGSKAGGYKVTLYLDGEIVIIYLDDDDIDEIFDGFDDGGGGGDDIGDYFDDDGGGGGDGGLIPTPTPSAEGGGLTPTPTLSAGGGGGGGQQTPPDCDLYGSSVSERTVISNTICDIDEGQ